MSAFVDKIKSGQSLISVETRLLNRARLNFLLSWSPDELALLEVKLLHFYNQDYMWDFLEIFAVRTLGGLYSELVVSWG